jgi:hypothetical protein
MNKTIITAAHNPKSEATVPTTLVVELGKATNLTLGGGHVAKEGPYRPHGQPDC